MKFIFSMALSAGLVFFGATQARAADEPSGSATDELGAPLDEDTSEGKVIRERVREREVIIQPSEESPPAEERGGYGTGEDTTEAEPMVPEETTKPTEEPTPYMTQPKLTVIEQETHERKMPGLSILAGGGIFGYGKEAARDATTDVGAGYTARLGIGTELPVGFEIGYIGTVQNINALGVEDDAKLVSNGVEGALRLNFLPNAIVQPYILGGAAWKRYDVAATDVNTSSVRDNDNVVEFPVGGGLSYQLNQFIVDLRGEYRFATDEELIRGVRGGDVDMDNWDVGLKAGVEF